MGVEPIAASLFPDTAQLSEDGVSVGACVCATSPRRSRHRSLSMTRRLCVSAAARRRDLSTTASPSRRSPFSVGRWPVWPMKRDSVSTSPPGGELDIVLRAGVPASRIIVHGNNKSREEIERAIAVGVHRLVVDNFDEIENLRLSGVSVGAAERAGTRDARRRGAHSRVRPNRPRGHQVRFFGGDRRGPRERFSN